MVSPQVERILQRLGVKPGVAPSRLKPRYPTVAVTVLPGRVGAVRLQPGGKGSDAPRVAAWKEMPLPAGTVAPSLTKQNLADPTPVEEALKAVLLEVAPRDERVSLVLPDSIARVSILKFNRMPAARREVMDLIRFRMQKVLPFRVEEAALDYQLLSPPAAPEPDFLVTLAQRTVLFQYERLLTGMDRFPGLVDLESFNLVNLVARARQDKSLDEGDWGLVNAAPGYLTVLFFRDGALSFYRSKALADEERMSDRFLPALRRELASCAAFYREHLSGAGLRSTVIRSSNGEARTLPGVVQEELGCPVEPLDPGKAVTLPPGTDATEARWQVLAPAIGAALGRRA